MKGKRGKDKNVSFGALVEEMKSVRQGADPESTEQQTPVWRFGRFDHACSCCKWDQDLWPVVIERMGHLENQRWSEIKAQDKKNHYVAVAGMEPFARRRLEELGVNEDSLFTMAMNGLPRIWGIRDRREFWILWWDPKHAVYKSEKKGT